MRSRWSSVINRLQVRMVALLSSIVFALLLCLCRSDTIVLNTGKDKVYNFFPNSNGYIEFSVKAANDVHIAFSRTPKEELPFYEVVLGGWDNSKSVLRVGYDQVAELGGPILPKKDRFHSFWVRVNDTEGSLAVGKLPGQRPLMKYHDPDYVKSNYVGLSTGFGSIGVFYFDNAAVQCSDQTPVNNYYSVILSPDRN